MFNPSVNIYAKSIFLDIAQQIALHHPERRDETLNWFSSLMEFFLNSTLEDNVIDGDLIAFLICNVIDINGIELLPQIEKLFERKLVSLDICGDLKEVRESFVLAESYDKKRTILSIKERYEEITSTWAGYNEEDHNDKFDYFKNFEDDKYFESLSLPVVAEQKIGRNAPCPCGSGKKYKKCCLNID